MPPSQGLVNSMALLAMLTGAAPGEVSEPLYDAFCAELEQLGTPVERGVFGAMMQVHSVNDGPFTVWLETPG